MINNTLDANIPSRSSLAQYRINPYQRGCAAAALAAPGCTTFNLFRSGAFGATVPVTADEGGFERDDRRTVVAARWEHDEVGADRAFAPGWRGTLACGFDDQIYTRYTEQLSAGSLTRRFDRAGNRIPGVPAHRLPARVGCDVPAGPLAGLGAFVETVVQGDFYLDNANLLKAPGYAAVNANVHYATELTGGYTKRLSVHLEVRNIFDSTYGSSAQDLLNSIGGGIGLQNNAAVLASTTGFVSAGEPRNIVGGMRLSF